MNGLPVLADYDSCTGCSACQAACPRQAITMLADAEGFLRPQVDPEKCIRCHMCERACPVLTPGVPIDPVECFAALTCDDALRMKSSSGGVFSELAASVLSSGGIVFGCAMEPGMLKAIHKGVETADALAGLRGSKYVQSDLRDTFREARAALKAGREVLFTGTPCQISGLNRFLGKDYDRLVTVEVLCHGAPSPAVFDEYKRKMEKRFHRAPESIFFRDKSKSWKRFSLVMSFGDSVEFRENLKKNIYLQSFLCDYTLRPSCYHCQAKSGRSRADITIGDFWGIQKVCPEFSDGRGVSAVLIHSEVGRRFWARCRQSMRVRQVEVSEILRGNPAYHSSVERTEGRDYFMRYYRTAPWKLLLRYLNNGRSLLWSLWLMRQKLSAVFHNRER